jgi:hypothetical protein
VLAIVVATPIEGLELEGERLAGDGDGFENLLSGGNDFPPMPSPGMAAGCDRFS